MNTQEVLEASIVDTPPPFPSIDELITRERRRNRARRAGAASASMVGLVAVILGVTLVTNQVGSFRSPGYSTQPPAESAPVTTRVAPARLPLLSLLFTTRLSTVLPGVDLVRSGGAAGVLTGDAGFGNEGDYLFLGAEAVVDPTPAIEDATRFTVVVFEPLTNAPLPTTGAVGALYGGCVGIWQDGAGPAGSHNCAAESGPGGSSIFYGWRDQQGTRELIAVMVFPDGMAVRIEAYGKPSTLPVTAENLAYVIADPRYVIPAWGPQTEIDPIPTPSADYATSMVSCLTPKGWDVEQVGDALQSSVPQEQQDRYQLDIATCQAQLQYGEIVTPPTANERYDNAVASADCLRGQGYSISEAPSREAYIEQLLAQQLPDWDPYAEVFTRAGGPTGVGAAQAACPQPTSW